MVFNEVRKMLLQTIKDNSYHTWSSEQTELPLIMIIGKGKVDNDIANVHENMSIMQRLITNIVIKSMPKSETTIQINIKDIPFISNGLYFEFSPIKCMFSKVNI